MRPASLKIQVSAGGVIFKRDKDKIEIVLVSVSSGNIWSLPKGLVNKGESYEDAAIREVREETGLTGKIIGDLGEISYWYFIRDENIKCRKTVHYYLMEYLMGDTCNHDAEVGDARWFSIDEALKEVTYRGDKITIKKAQDMIKRLIDNNEKITGQRKSSKDM